MAITKKLIGGAMSKAIASGVKKAAAKQKRAVGTNQSGKKSVKDMSKVDRLEFEFDGLKPTAQRAIIGKVRDGKQSKYADMLKERKGIKVKKAGGGKMKSKGYAAGGKMKSKGYKVGGKMSGKPRGVGSATRGFGKAMK